MCSVDSDVDAASILDLPVEKWLESVDLHRDLNSDIAEKYGSVPQHDPAAIAKTVLRIEEAARQCIAPCCSAHPFGSAVNGFGEASSDVDILLALDMDELYYYMSYVNWNNMELNLQADLEQQLRPAFVTQSVLNEKSAAACAVAQLSDFLPRSGFQLVRSLPFARKPLVTFEDVEGDLGEIDVTINNRLPLYNTELLRSYSQINDRVRPLVLLVKTWAKNHNVCGAGAGNLSSYTWTIMVIYFLQLVDGVPSLQALALERRMVSDIDYWGFRHEFEATFLSVDDYWSTCGDGNRKGLGVGVGELLYGFFRFLSREYIWGKEVMSIRCPERLEADGWWRVVGKSHAEPGIHVEDPIELRDLNIVLRRDRLAQLKAELARAVDMLQGGCSLDEFLSSEPLSIQIAMDHMHGKRRRPGGFQIRQRNFGPR